MANFRGFNTINQEKKFSLNDKELIKRDLLNAFSIKEGEMPGRPDIGTSIWAYVFEPLDALMQTSLRDEVTRVVEADSRIELQDINISVSNNTVVISLDVLLHPESDYDTFELIFDEESSTVAIM